MATILLQVIVDRKRLATIILQDIVLGVELSQQGSRLEVVLQMSDMQLIDHLCASPHYREAVTCLPSSSSSGDKSSPRIQIAFLLSHVRHVQPTQSSSPQGMSFEYLRSVVFPMA